MTELTKPQAYMLTQAMRGATFATGRRMRVGANLRRMGFVRGSDALTATPAGVEALREYRMRRWGKYGCNAYLEDLREVEAVLAAL